MMKTYIPVNGSNKGILSALVETFLISITMKKRIFTLVTLLMVIAMNMQMMAQSVHPYKAYAVYNEGSLTFYYDECYTSQTGTVYRFDVNNNYIEGREPMWVKKHGSEITTASFDESFADISLSFLCDMFANCTNLKTITGLENVNTSQVTNMAGMFYNCASLEGSLNLCDWNTGNVTDMNEMFYGCSNLTAIDVSGWNTEKVTSMESMFYNCNKLKRLNLSSWNTVKVTNMEWMFRDCSQLKYILCGDNWSVAKVTESDKMFGGCSSLVGGAGTTYNASHIDASYAHIDGGSNNPGYLRKPIRIGNSITINDFEWPTDFEPTDYDASTSTSGCRVSRVYYVQYMKEVSYPVGYANDNLTICFEIEATDGVFDTNPYPSAYIGDLIADGRMIKNEGIIVFSFPYQVPTPDGGKYIRSASASVTEPTVAESQAKAMNAAPAKARPEPTYTVSDPIWIEMKNGKPSFATS